MNQSLHSILSLPLYTNVWIIYIYITPFWHFGRNYFKLVYHFGDNWCHLYVRYSNLQIWYVSHLFGYLVSFINILYLLTCNYCTHCIKFMPSYFFFWVIITGIAFLISVFMYSLLIYGNTIDFYIFFLYPATLSKSLITSRNFFGDYLGIFYIYNLASCKYKPF